MKAFVSSMAHTEGRMLTFNVSETYTIPKPLLLADSKDFESILNYASKLLDLQSELSTQYAKDIFFADLLKDLQKSHASELLKVEKEANRETSKSIQPLVDQISGLTQDKARSESEMKRAFDKELQGLQRQVAELQVDLQRASRAEGAIREQCRSESDRMIQMIESKNQQLLQAKEESLRQREVLLTQKESELQTKLMRQSSSSLRGQDGEVFFANLAKEKMEWDLTDTRHIARACDYQGKIHNTVSFFEVKHYTHPVPQKEVTKFLRDMKEHPEALFGAFISLNTHIQGRNPQQSISLEWINDTQCIMYIQACCDLDIDQVFCTIDQVIKVTHTFNKILSSNQTESNEPVFQQRIDQAKEYLQNSVLRCQGLMRRINADKKQILSLIESSATHSLLELKQQSTELATAIQILLGDYNEEPSQEEGETPVVLVTEKPKKVSRKKKADTVVISL